MPLNEYGQPVGERLAWAPRSPLVPIDLAGRHCRLEPMREAHLDGLYAALCLESSSDIWTYMSEGPFDSRDGLAAYLHRLRASPATIPLVIAEPAGAPMGIACFQRIDQANGVVEIGSITVGSPWQRSTASTEALHLMACHVLDDLGFRRLEWKCDALNEPSRRAAVRLGFSFEGVFRRAVVYKQRNRDTAWFSITDDDWPLVRAAHLRWLDPANFDDRGIQRTRLKTPGGGLLGRGWVANVSPMDTKQALTGQQILEEDLGEWRFNLGRLVARFATGDFNAGAAFVMRIAEAADAADHHPDVDLRYPHVTVTLASHDVQAVTSRDVQLARAINDIAAELEVSSAGAPDLIELALDTPQRESVKPFWEALLGYRRTPGFDDDLSDRAGRSPSLWFQHTDSEEPDRQRFHLDVSVPHDQAEQRLQAALDAGGTLVSDTRAPAFWVLEDPDGNRACICTWQNRD